MLSAGNVSTFIETHFAMHSASSAFFGNSGFSNQEHQNIFALKILIDLIDDC